MDDTHKIMNAPLVGVFINAVLAAVKITGGVVGSSGALVADGIESCADVVSSLVVWGGLRISLKPADEDHPYGHGKAEPLAASVAAIALVVAAVVIAIESVKQIIRRTKVRAGIRSLSWSGSSSSNYYCQDSFRTPEKPSKAPL